MCPTPVVIADRYPLTRLGVLRALDHVPQCTVVGEADCVSEVLRLAEAHAPGLVVLGMNLPAAESVALAGTLSQAGTRVLALSGLEGEPYLYDMLRQRAVGFLSKLEPQKVLVDTIEAIVAGGSGLISASIIERLSRAALAPPEHLLSGREREVICLIAQGYSNSRVAESLFVAPNTIKNHITSIFAKLGVASRSEAIVWAWRRGLVHA